MRCAPAGVYCLLSGSAPITWSRLTAKPPLCMNATVEHCSRMENLVLGPQTYSAGTSLLVPVLTILLTLSKRYA